MALNDPVITIEDVRTLRDVDTHYSGTRFGGFLKGIQDGDLQELLGAELWLDFFTDITDTKYTTLIDGEAYTYQGETILYPGLKPFLIWAWLGVLPLEGNVHHTQSGDYAYLKDVTTSPSKAAMNQAKETYKRNMMIESNKITRYLNAKTSVYPLWNSTSQDNETRLQIDFI
jgi:hypothetical protein